MLGYIERQTAAPYFSNLVWFIAGKVVWSSKEIIIGKKRTISVTGVEIDLLILLLSTGPFALSLKNIFLIDIDTLNEVLTDKLLNRSTVMERIGFIILYQFSHFYMIISSECSFYENPHSTVWKWLKHLVASLSSQRISDHPLWPLNAAVGPRHLSGGRWPIPTRWVIRGSPKMPDSSKQARGLSRPEEPATAALVTAEVLSSPSTEGGRSPCSEVCSGDTELSSPTQNSTDEEKLMGRTQHRLGPASVSRPQVSENVQTSFSLDNRPYLEAIFNALECSENDYSALFALCLLYAMGKSEGLSQNLLDTVLMPTQRSHCKKNYNLFLVERLIRIIELACQSGNKVRLATLEISIKLLKQLVNSEEKSYLQDRHLACIENARECCTQLLRNFYKTRPLNVEYLMQDASILLPPTGTPLTGIDFNKRLPCGEVERARRAIRVFFMVRDLSLNLMHEAETQLPLTKEENCIKTEDVLDLNNSDLIGCTVVNRESRRQERRFLVIDPVQLILVEPDTKRLGWGVVKFVGYLQDVEVSGDKDDSRLLHIVVHRPQSSVHAKPIPILSAKFVFDDHIRCMAAKQRLIKGRQRARQQKMTTIERLLDISQSEERGHFARAGPIPGVSGRINTNSANLSSSANSGKMSRKVTPEQRRLLQAKAAQRSKAARNSSVSWRGPIFQGRTRHCSSGRVKPGGMTCQGSFPFSAQLVSESLVGGVSSRQQEISNSALGDTKSESARRLSVPVMLDPTKKTMVTKICTATQVGRPHSPRGNPTDPQDDYKSRPRQWYSISKKMPVWPFAGCHSQAADAPVLSSYLSLNIPKQPGAVKAEARPEVMKSEGLTVQKLSLHGLQMAADERRLDDIRDDIKMASAISPETPSSDSAMSSDTSMISVSSLASREQHGCGL
ncbi:Protein CL16A [Bulinus truncatus]|nr:Protein CL16A [Bulinus truncatus]